MHGAFSHWTEYILRSTRENTRFQANTTVGGDRKFLPLLTTISEQVVASHQPNRQTFYNRNQTTKVVRDVH